MNLNLSKGFWLLLGGAAAAGGIIALAAFASYYFPSFLVPCISAPAIIIFGIVRAVKYELKHGEK